MGLHRPWQVVLRGLELGLELRIPSGDLRPPYLGKYSGLGLGMAGDFFPTLPVPTMLSRQTPH